MLTTHFYAQLDVYESTERTKKLINKLLIVDIYTYVFLYIFTFSFNKKVRKSVCFCKVFISFVHASTGTPRPYHALILVCLCQRNRLILPHYILYYLKTLTRSTFPHCRSLLFITVHGLCFSQ